jgi:hypothetical protein
LSARCAERAPAKERVVSELAAALRVVVRCLEAELELGGAIGVDREVAFWMLYGDLKRRGYLGPREEETGRHGQRSASRRRIRRRAAGAFPGRRPLV